MLSNVRKILFILPAFVALIFLAACGSCDSCGPVEVEVTREVEVPIELNLCEDVTKTWTALVYLAVDNDLEEMGNEMFSSIARGVEANPCMNIVVLYDTHGNEGTKIWVYEMDSDAGFNPMAESDLQGFELLLGEVDTGNPETLSKFISWTQDKYPTDHYFLSIVSHGWGFIPDDETILNQDRARGVEIEGDLGGTQ